MHRQQVDALLVTRIDSLLQSCCKREPWEVFQQAIVGGAKTKWQFPKLVDVGTRMIVVHALLPSHGLTRRREGSTSTESPKDV